MEKTIIVSNRLPIEIKFENNSVQFNQSVGGLATGLSALHPKDNNIWVGWLGIPEENVPTDELKDEALERVISHDYIPVSLTQQEIVDYYEGFSNRIIWPLFHYFTQYAAFSKKKWRIYQQVNKKFADEILEYADDGDTVWVHDYHLMLVPKLLREKKKKLHIGCFLHIPFPSFEVFRTLPCREAILEGLLGCDLLGFHTLDYQQHFLESVSQLLDAEIKCNDVIFQGKVTRVQVYPMGIDAKKFQEEAQLQMKSSKKKLPLREELENYKKENPNVKYILSIDRMDYTKGIENRIRAFEYFLKYNPRMIGQVRLLMVAVPSRTNVQQYQKLKRDIDELVGRVNSKYATLGWSPIQYFYRSFPFESLIELYTSCDIALITPIRDGMNLVAKEYVMARTGGTGVLILSEMTGAAKELAEALLINPTSYQQISDALTQALEMPEAKQEKRLQRMQERLLKYNVNHWAQEFISDLQQTANRETRIEPLLLNETAYDTFRKKYRQSEKRLFLLDYDGTLVGFKDTPSQAAPDEELLGLIEELSRDEKNNVYLVSGRDRTSLQTWFDKYRIHLIAEHGAYSKRCFDEWCSHPNLNDDWMQSVLPLMEKLTDRTPGSFVEQKKHSLAWHYRKADTELGNAKAKELLKMLNNWIPTLGISLLNGNKVVEVTNGHINKGIAIQEVIHQGNFDFILAMGDDHTDEMMFDKLPTQAISVKVGMDTRTLAKYAVKDFREARKVLEYFIKKDLNKVNVKEKIAALNP